MKIGNVAIVFSEESIHVMVQDDVGFILWYYFPDKSGKNNREIFHQNFLAGSRHISV